LRNIYFLIWIQTYNNAFTEALTKRYPYKYNSVYPKVLSNPYVIVNVYI